MINFYEFYVWMCKKILSDDSNAFEIMAIKLSCICKDIEKSNFFTLKYQISINLT